MSLAQYYSDKKVYSKVGRGRLDGILSLVGDLNNKKILDIGCGSGELGRELKKRFPSVQIWGLDVSPAAVEEAKKILDRAEVADLTEAWPAGLKEQNFDFIIASEVLEHLFWPENLLVKIKENFSAPMIITVPNLLFWKNRLKIFRGFFDYTDIGLMDRGHIHFFSWDSLRKMIEGTNFKLVASANFAPTRGTRSLARFWPGLLAYQFIVKIASR